jgi:ABC-type Fe3+-hydroxamate transport system substrate-binding protein
VGGTKKINLKKLLSLEPDIVIGNKEENTPEMYAAISPHVPFWTCDVQTLEDNYRLIGQLGAICQQPSAASTMIAKTRNSLQMVTHLKPFKGKKVLYLIWRNPWMSVGGDTFIHHVLQYLGLENVTAHFQRYPIINNLMGDLHPDLIFFSSEPYPFQTSDFEALCGIFPKSQFLLVQGEYFSWFGSHMTDAGNYLRQLAGWVK